MLLETVFQYRLLIGKCDLGLGLDWDEIDHVRNIEHAFAAHIHEPSGRKFRRHKIETIGILRGENIHDRVHVVELGPGGFVCEHAPYIARGEQIEIIIDDGEDSYRFRAQGAWLRDRGDDYRVGFQFIGMPVKLHKVQISEHTLDVVDKIAAAA